MQKQSNQEWRKRGKNSWNKARKFTRRRNVRGAHASSVLVSASCRNELFHDSMIAKPSKILKPIPEREMSEWARIASQAHKRATKKKRAELRRRGLPMSGASMRR